MELDHTHLFDIDYWRKILANLRQPFSSHEELGLLNEILFLQKELLLSHPVFSKCPAKVQEFHLNTFPCTFLQIYLSKSESTHPQHVGDILHNYLEAIALHFSLLKQCRLYEILELLLDSSKKYYTSSPGTLSEQLGLTGDKDFISTLAVGQQVDVVCNRGNPVSHWLTLPISQVAAKYIQVTYPDKHKEKVPLGWKVQPARSRNSLQDDVWRKDLRIGDYVDAYGPMGIWIQSSISEVYETQMKVEVAFRVDRLAEENKEVDSDEDSFIGLGSKYDTDMSIFDPRIRRNGTMAKSFSYKANKKDNQVRLDDTNDLLLRKEYSQKKIFAVVRDPINLLYPELINRFGELGGFDLILSRLNDKSASAEELDGLIYSLMRISENLTRMFFSEFMAKFKDSVWDCLLESDDTLIRGLSIKKYERLMFCLPVIMLRYLTEEEFSDWIQNLNLELCSRCLKSSFLDRKIMAMKILDELIKACLNKVLSKDKSDLIAWISQEELFELIFGPSAHSQLASRSYDFFKFVFPYLMSNQLEQFWSNLSRHDITIKEIIFKFMLDAQRKIRMPQLQYIAANLHLISPADINEDFLDFILFQHKEISELHSNSANFLWGHLINDYRAFKPDVRQLATKRMVDIIRKMSWPSDFLLKILNDAMHVPPNKTIVNILTNIFFYNMPVEVTNTMINYTAHLINSLKDLPVHKYASELKDILDLITDFESLTSNQLTDEQENIIISSIKSEGSINLLKFLSKRKSKKLIEPALDQLTPESFRLLMEIYEATVSNDPSVDPTNEPFYPYLIKVLEQHKCPETQQMSCQVLVSLYHLSYKECGPQFLRPFLVHCLSQNSIPYYRVMQRLIETIQNNWPFATFANIYSKNHEIEVTTINDIHTILSSDVSRTQIYKLKADRSLRLLVTLLLEKTGLEQIRILQNGTEINPSNYIKTLDELKFTDKTSVHYSRRYNEIRRKLVNPRKIFIGPVQRIFRSQYRKFARTTQEGLALMTPEDFQRFFGTFSVNRQNMQQNRLEGLFLKFDRNKKGGLTEDQFVEYWQSQVREPQIFVTGFIDRMGYNTSTFLPKGEKHQTDYQTVPAALLLENSHLFDILFENLRNSKDTNLEKEIIGLLKRLPPQISYFRDPQQCLSSLQHQQNLYIIWYKLIVIRKLIDPEVAKDLVCFDAETLKRWDGILEGQGGFQLVLNVAKRIYLWEGETVYIYTPVLKLLFIELKKLYSKKATVMFPSLDKVFPPPPNCSALFIPACPEPMFEPTQTNICLVDSPLSDWLAPRPAALTRLINEVIFELLMLDTILGNSHTWHCLDLKFQTYKLEQYQLYSISLSMWRNRFTSLSLMSFIQEGKQYMYQLVAFMIENYYQRVESEIGMIAQTLVESLLKHKSTERMNSEVQDVQLVGILTILETIFRKNSSLCTQYLTLIQQLMYSFLFFEKEPKIQGSETPYAPNFQPSQYIKCFSKESRSKAYNVILALITHSPQEYQRMFHHFIAKLTHNVATPKRLQKMISPTRCPDGYVGLRNLGATCYMNSVLQQLFVCDQLVNLVMSIPSEQRMQRMDVEEAETVVGESKNETKYEKNWFILELQRLFSYLKFSDRMDFEPTEFFKHVRLGGVKVPTIQQQDAHEFLNFFFSEVEPVLQKQRLKKVLENIYGGTQCLMISCQGCGHVKSAIEQHYEVGLEVKELNNLQQSLNKLIEGEMICDYFCENCSSKQTVHKRVLLDSVPNHLIIRLQRIVFDLDSVTNKKIHTKFQFPQNLDLYPYTKSYHSEGIGRKKSTLIVDENEQNTQGDLLQHEYNYELAGVVVHVGHAQGGHYYSLIKKNGKWLEFNDSRIYKFTDSLQKECFGGIMPDDDWSKEEFSKSAYMLVYEKKNKKPYSAVQQSVVAGPKVVNSLWQEVWQDNHQLVIQNILLSESLNRFIVKILELLPKPELLQNCPILTSDLEENVKCLYEIGARFIEYFAFELVFLREIDPNLIQQLRLMMKYTPTIASEILSKYVDIKYLLASTQEYRNVLKDLYIDCISIEIYLNGGLTDCVKSFIDKVLICQLNNQVVKNWGKSAEVFYTISQLVQQNHLVSNYLIKDKELLAVALDFFLQSESPLKLVEKKPYSFNSSITYGSLMPFLNLLNSCFARHLTFSDQVMAYQMNTAPLPLPESVKTIKMTVVLRKLMKDRMVLSYLGILIQHVCYSNLEESRKFAKWILEGINCFSPDQLSAYTYIIDRFLNIIDEYVDHRYNFVLGFPQLRMNSQGSFALTHSLNTHVYTYPSTLSTSLFSFLDLIAKERLEWKNYMIVGVCFLFNQAQTNEKFFTYVRNLPPPTYKHAHFFEVFEDFIYEYDRESYKFNRSDFSANDFAVSTKQAYLSLKQRISKTIAENLAQMRKTQEVFAKKYNLEIKSEQPEIGISKGFTNSYIYGTTISIKKVITAPSVEVPSLQLIIYDFKVHRVLSRPTTFSNRVFPSYFIDTRGDFVERELSEYPQLERLVQTQKRIVGGKVKLQLISAALPDSKQDDYGISFDTTTDKKSGSDAPKQKRSITQIPIQFEGEQPADKNFGVIRAFYLTNTNSEISLNVRVSPLDVSVFQFCPKEREVRLDGEDTVLCLVSVDNLYSLKFEVISSAPFKSEPKPTMVAEDTGFRNVITISGPDETKANLIQQNLPMEEESDKIACRICSFHNDLYRQRCEMCDHNLFY